MHPITVLDGLHELHPIVIQDDADPLIFCINVRGYHWDIKKSQLISVNNYPHHETPDVHNYYIEFKDNDNRYHYYKEENTQYGDGGVCRRISI